MNSLSLRKRSWNEARKPLHMLYYGLLENLSVGFYAQARRGQLICNGGRDFNIRQSN